MDAIENLLNRFSVPAKQLDYPIPSAKELDILFQSAATAPDHCKLRPWRFLIIEGEARYKLGEVFKEAYRRRDPSANEDALENYRQKPLRAPLILVAVANIQNDNPKVPEIEQVISTACATQHIQLAAQAMGYHSIWLTGVNTRDWYVNESLGLDFDEKIIAYLYIGTAQTENPKPTRPQVASFVSQWIEPANFEDTVI